MTDPLETDAKQTGHCLCGTVQFEFSGDLLFAGHCHCESCRRQTASGFTTFIGVPNGAWAWTVTMPSVYESTPGQKRYFCPTCGAPVAYSSSRWPDEIHLYPALLDHPNSITPNEHYHWEERVHWAAPADDLPKHTGTIAQLAGEGNDRC